MRLFRAVRAVELSLVLVCGVRPSMRRLRAVWRCMRLGFPGFGGAVRLVCGLCGRHLAAVFSNSHLKPSPGIGRRVILET